MIGRKIIHKDTLQSTNNYIANLSLDSKIEHGTVIMTDFQSDGKGQREAIWESEPYKNLIFSCFLKHDNLAVKNQFDLNCMISVAVCELLNSYQQGFQIKWPNDIVFEKSKIAGILIENQIQSTNIVSSIVGIGININQVVFETQNATSLKTITGNDILLQEVLFKLIHKLNKWHAIFQFNDYAHIKENYLKNLWLLKQKSRFKDENGEFEGEICGISEIGELIVLKNEVEVSYKNKEIVFMERR